MKKVVWVNGCFDILHRGHIELFKYAKSLGDYLIVGLDSDERIRETKGKDRPFNNLQDRISMLGAIKYIDSVVSFNTDRELELCVDYYRPKIMVVGSDWKEKTVIGQEYANEVKYFGRIGDYSTTKILEKK